MQKLEEILHAEEAARHAVASARERADEILREALSEARRVMNSGHDEAVAEAERIREERRAAARAEAEALHRSADEEIEVTVSRARARLDGAVASAVRELVG